MKNGKLQSANKGKLQLALISMTMLVVLAGCTKSRKAEIADEELQQRIFAINELHNKNFEIQTGEAVQISSGTSLSADAEKPKAKIKKSNVPDRLQNLFSQTSVQADASATYPVRFTVNKKYVNVFKIVSNEASLTLVEKKLAQKDGANLVVPLFKIPVARYGVIKKVKNENKEETSRLNLFETDFAQATHIEIPIRFDDLKKVGEDTNTLRELDQVFVASKLEGQVTTLAELGNQLNVSIYPSDDTKVFTTLESSQGGSGSLLVYSVTSLSEIKDEKLLQKLRGGLGQGTIENCPASVTKQLAADKQKDCVIVLTHEVALSFVSPKLTKEDGDGTLSTSIEFDSSDKTRSSGLVKIAENTIASSKNVLDLTKVNPYNTIRVVDIKGKEFLLRRTFEDGASGIMVFGPGASGNMDIVTLEMEDNRVVVRRATTINGDRKAGNIDREELMSIPVSYKKRDLAKGSATLNVVETSKEQAEYISLDWSQNSIPSMNSPLSYMDAGACFQAVGDMKITDLDNRISQGSLNFSISGSYSFAPDCMSWYNMKDYWWGNNQQSNFNLKERVSFKLHTKELDNKPGLNIPYRAQNLMGYGVFTAGEITQNEFGTGGNTVDTLNARPVIHDFSNGKKLVYTLGGLPESGWMREALIEGTKEVVADWNKSLAKAFAGTELARSTPYIELLIDGVDAPKGRLGDLDKNYIWNFEKNLDSGLLGMSQAGPNPRSGRIEQNNVLMYSGNLLAQIGGQQQLAKLQREHRAMKEAALLAYDAEQALAKKVQAAGNVAEKAATAEGTQSIVNSMINRAQFTRPLTPALNVGSASAIGYNSLKATASKTPRVRNESTSRAQNMMEKMNQTAYLKRIFDKAVEAGATRDPLMLNSLSAAEVLKAYGSRMSPAERNALATQSRTLALMAEFNKNFQKGPNCAITANAAGGGLVDDTDLQPKEVLFKEWYKTTLAHEVGHSLGLTHNFQGSLDKQNFLFSDEKQEEKSRNYSSVMDYIPDQLQHYNGPGPYDVHALRASYTGLVEGHPQMVAQAKKMADGKTYVGVRSNKVGADGKPVATALEILPGGLVRMEDIKKITLGEQSWWRADAQTMSRIPLKKYAYCADIHVGGDPTCNRWDMGTNEVEIAKFYANEYRNYYPAMNSLGNRIDMRGMGSYIGRLFNQFFNLRPFMDETFYKLISGVPAQAVMPTVYAGLEGLNLFAEIVGTPSIQAHYEDMNRFSVIPVEIPKIDDKGQIVTDASGKKVIDRVEKVVVESKPVQDLMVPGYEGSVKTRGIEYDKAIAIMMLTQRGIGHPRYESVGLRVSYADFEGLFQIPAAQSTTLGVLSEIINDNPVAKVNTPIGLVNLSPAYEPTTTEIIRYYAILGSTVLLDADTIEERNNFAGLFRIGSSLKTIPKGKFAISKLDNSLTSETALKLWAFDNSTLGHNIVRSAAQKRALIEKAARLNQGLLVGLKGVMEKNDAQIKVGLAQVTELLRTLNKDGLFLTEEEAAMNNVTIEKFAEIALQFMSENMALAKQAITLVESKQISAEDLPALLSGIARNIEVNAKDLAIIGSAEKALFAGFPESTKEGQVFRAFMSDQHLEQNHGMVTSNLQFINKIVTEMYPELNRLQ